MAKPQSLNQELLEDPQLNQTINLSDGRTLGYAEYGVAEGQPILYFHGGNGSRLEGQWFADATTENNIQLIAPDRPGFGLSDFQPDRQIRGWAIPLTNNLILRLRKHLQ